MSLKRNEEFLETLQNLRLILLSYQRFSSLATKSRLLMALILGNPKNENSKICIRNDLAA